MLRIQKDELGQSKVIGEEQGQEAGNVKAGGEINQVISSKKPALGNRRSMAKPSKSKAHKSSASLASKQMKVKASMHHKAKMPKENEEKADVEGDMVEIQVVANEDKGKKVADSIPNEDKMDVDAPAKSILKKAISSRKIMSKNKSSFVPAKLSDIDNMHSKVMIENASINLYVTVRHMKLREFRLEKAYLDKSKFDMARSGVAGKWFEQIDKLAKHVENVQKSLAEFQ
ncbi:hypothetical protein SLEP1_g22537 [Rubroshorea leprosula]|uniref:Uncharacterized protein n=1 Tax=Rubroshorea leprosula TaxID=152421 RepID=A0AAV5JEV6_9ROSI|nr:hypothetical protein SLEP1_g22537 [Rubroshorea leprosula]